MKLTKDHVYVSSRGCLYKAVRYTGSYDYHALGKSKEPLHREHFVFTGHKGPRVEPRDKNTYIAGYRVVSTKRTKAFVEDVGHLRGEIETLRGMLLERQQELTDLIRREFAVSKDLRQADVRRAFPVKS